LAGTSALAENGVVSKMALAQLAPGSKQLESDSHEGLITQQRQSGNLPDPVALLRANGLEQSGRNLPGR